MPVCSYVVIPQPGRLAPLTERLAAIPGCEVTRATNREVLLLVTETADGASEATLRAALEAIPGIQELLLTFGDLAPDGPGAP